MNKSILIQSILLGIIGLIITFTKKSRVYERVAGIIVTILSIAAIFIITGKV